MMLLSEEGDATKSTLQRMSSGRIVARSTQSVDVSTTETHLLFPDSCWDFHEPNGRSANNDWIRATTGCQFLDQVVTKNVHHLANKDAFGLFFLFC